MEISLLPDNPGAWTYRRYEDLLAIPREAREKLQLEAVRISFERMRNRIPALKKLADRQGVERIEKLEDALPVSFDHRVLKNYPLQILEDRDLPKLTAWLDKLTAHDLGRMDLTGVRTIQGWLERLDAYGMLVTYSSGTSGKLSFIPRSRDEFGPWRANNISVNRAACGHDWTYEKLPTFYPGYRTGHQTAIRMMMLFGVEQAGGEQNFHSLYDTAVSADLMALAGRLQSAEDKGEIDRLGLDPVLLEQRQLMLAQGRRRDEDLQAWYAKMITEFKGRKVWLNGIFSELYRVAVTGLEKGMKCEFHPDSVMVGGGGMKNFKGAGDDWEGPVKEFFGVRKVGNLYGCSECIGNAPLCEAGYFHFLPYVVPMLMDPDGNALPREGVQTGRYCFVDVIPTSYWGGFTTGDEVTIHWEDGCACGWRGPRAEKKVTRFAGKEGGDDKITCAGSGAAYNEFMDYMMGV